MIEKIKKWQIEWEKQYSKVRLRWIHELSPKAFQWFNSVELLYGEVYGNTFIIYFRANKQKYRLEFQTFKQRKPLIYIKKNLEHYVLNNDQKTLKYRKPFKEKDAKIIETFLLSKEREIKIAARRMKIEEHEKNDGFVEKFVGLQKGMWHSFFGT